MIQRYRVTGWAMLETLLNELRVQDCSVLALYDCLRMRKFKLILKACMAEQQRRDMQEMPLVLAPVLLKRQAMA